MAPKIYVSPSPTTFQLHLKFGDPCLVLRQFRTNRGPTDETELAVRQCLTVFKEQIANNLLRLGNSRYGGPINIVPSGKFQPAPRAPMAKPETNQIIKLIDDNLALKRDKRGLVDFCLGCFFTNVIETVTDRIWPNPALSELKEHQDLLDHKLATITMRYNFTELQVKALAESQQLTAQLVEHNVEQIHALQFTYPSLAIVAANIVAKMHLTGSYLEKLRSSFRMRRPDIEILVLLFKFDTLLEVDPASIIEDSVSLAATGNNALVVEFAARRRATDTVVYQVNAFRYWGDLMEKTPKLYEYVGPKYVIRNKNCGCVRGISPPQNSYVTAQCLEKNFEDVRLASWKVVSQEEDPEAYPSQTEVIEVWPYVLINCFPGTIEIGNTTRTCPPYPFKLNASERWSTATYEYSPAAIEFNTEQLSSLVVDVNMLHFRNSSHRLEKEPAFRKIRQLLEKGVLFGIRPTEIRLDTERYPLYRV